MPKEVRGLCSCSERLLATVVTPWDDCSCLQRLLAAHPGVTVPIQRG